MNQIVKINTLTPDLCPFLSPFLIFLQAVATKLDLPDDLVGYFSLFLVREGVDGGLTCEFLHQSL